MTKRLNRIVVILRRKSNPGAFALQAEVFCERMTGNPYFPNPTPSIAEVRTAIAELLDAQAATLSLARGLTTIRDAKHRVLIGHTEAWRALVEKVANENPEAGQAIVDGMTMECKGAPTVTKPWLAVYQGHVSGTVRIVARAIAKKASYEWQWSGDEGATWHAAGRTTQADTEVSGLTPGKTYWFRFRGTTPKGQGDWVEPVAFLVK